MNKWEEVKLSDVTKFIDGDRGKNYPKQHEYLDDGYCLFLNTSNVTSEGFNFDKTNYISKEKDEVLRKGRLNYNDLILTTRGTIGNIVYYKERMFSPMRINSSMLILRVNDDIVSQVFIYYLIKSKSFREYMNLYSSGSAQPQLPVKDLRQIKIQIPDLKTQEKIADLLSTYDELIENNNRRIEILEKTAEEIYKEWFVRMRFPGHENTKFTKGIPEGWEVKRVGDLVNRLQAGHFYREEELYEEGEVIVIDQSTKKYMGFHNEEPTHIADIDNPIILFGDHSCKMIVMTRKFSLGENVIPFISNNNHPVLFLYYSLKGLIQTEEYKRHWKELINKKIYYPEIWLQEKFRDTIKDNFEMIEKYKDQNQNLIKQRDLLLPRLMNGTIEVK